MKNKILWIGGVHGVGKSTAVDGVVTKFQGRLRKFYLGESFYNQAQKEGFDLLNTPNDGKLVRLEEVVTQEIISELCKSDLAFDAHFCVHLSDKFPGFHNQNLQEILNHTNNSALINIIASPKAVISRRKNSPKKTHFYPTLNNIRKIEEELADSNEYFRYFEKIFDRRGVIRIIDSTDMNPQEIIMDVSRIYHAL